MVEYFQLNVDEHWSTIEITVVNGSNVNVPSE